MSKKRIASLFFCVFVFAMSRVADAQTAALGRGLTQIVQMYEGGNPKLDQVLKPHIMSEAGEILVEIRLQPGVTSAQALPSLTASAPNSVLSTPSIPTIWGTVRTCGSRRTVVHVGDDNLISSHVGRAMNIAGIRRKQ